MRPESPPRRRLAVLLTTPVVLAAGALTVPALAAAPGPAGPLAVPAYSSFDVLDSGAPVQVRTLSTRPELVTGGDVLVEVVVPKGTDVRRVRVKAGSRDVTAAFRAAGPGLRGLVTRLPAGRTTLVATVPGAGQASLPVTNVGLQAPSFSGPLIQPWTCTNGATRTDCSKNAAITYVYKPTGGGALAAYDPASPPGDVATTTTDEGRTVPFVVRVETGTSLRDQYRIAALFDPATQGRTPSPTAANPGFADKLVLTHGVSCDTSYEGTDAPDVLFEDALGQGFAVASHALDNAGHNCNMVTQAESLVRTKEMVVERFGPLRYTIGSGCSGGSLVQQQVANAFPGVYQGITPQCSFTDAWSSAQQYVDYVGLRRFLEGAGAAQTRIVPAQWPSIFGHANPANQISFTEAIPNSGDPSRDCPGVAPEKVFTTESQKGVRCSFQDYMKNVFGLDAQGKAHRPISNVGVQYGLSGLLAGLGGTPDPTRPPLTADQFVALNAGVGGFDIDFDPTAARTQGDPVAMDRVYRSGAANTAAHLDQVAIIDLGGPEPGAFHDVYRKFAMRDRLVREHGTSANQVFWQGQTPLLGDVSFVDASITKMDEWLAAVEADRSATPLAAKVIAAKAKAGVVERCAAPGGATDLPLEQCRAAVGATLFSSPRIEAGGGDEALVNGVGPAKVGFTDDRLDCQTMPIEKFVYAGRSFTDVFTPAQQATLRTTFPTGVCDYSKPGKGFQAATTWLTYQAPTGAVVYGGTPLGKPPVSRFTR